MILIAFCKLSLHFENNILKIENFVVILQLFTKKGRKKSHFLSLFAFLPKIGTQWHSMALNVTPTILDTPPCN